MNIVKLLAFVIVSVVSLSAQTLDTLPTLISNRVFIASNALAASSSPIVGSSTTNIAFVRTNLAMNVIYTNTSGHLWGYKVDAWISPSAVVGIVRVAALVDDGGGTFVARELMAQNTLLGLTIGNQTNNVQFLVPNGGRCYVTNLSTGIGNSAGIVASTGERIQY